MFKKVLSSLFGGDNNKATNEPVIHQNENVDNDLETETVDEDDDEDEESFIELDPETLHGTNYTVEDFDAEVERLVQERVARDKADGEDIKEKDIENYRFNIRRDVYRAWTGADWDQTMQWEEMNSMKHRGVASFGNTQHDDSNPMLEPIHGVTLEDYATICYKLATQANLTNVLTALGIDNAVWDEANTLWGKRMQEDTSFTVITLFGQYYGTAEHHPKLQNVHAEISDLGKKTLVKLRSDRYFYEELAGARTAAYEYGMDGAQWMLDNYGVSLGDFQKVATEYAETDNKNFNSELRMEYAHYQIEKQKEYAEKFAKEQGGNIADDINF